MEATEICQPSQIKLLDWNKHQGLIPAIIQNIFTKQVLMQGYMSPESLKQTLLDKKICFYSRSKHRLWTKGESSGNFLNLKHIFHDCDKDSLLIIVDPVGDTCHLGHLSCYNQPEETVGFFIPQLEHTIEQRLNSDEAQSSYTKSLFNEGLKKIAQKVGEEGVEVALAGADQKDDSLLEESADLMYHLLLLLKARGKSFRDVDQVLRERHYKGRL